MYLYTALSKQTTVMSYFDEMHASYVHQNIQLCLNDHPHSIENSRIRWSEPLIIFCFPNKT